MEQSANPFPSRTPIPPNAPHHEITDRLKLKRTRGKTKTTAHFRAFLPRKIEKRPRFRSPHVNTAVKLSPRSRARTHSPNFDFLPSPFTAHPQRTQFQPFSGEDSGLGNLHRASQMGEQRVKAKEQKPSPFTLSRSMTYGIRVKR